MKIGQQAPATCDIQVLFEILGNPETCWVPMVTAVHDDIDASIQQRMKDSN